jgi:hypothetical protein
MATVIWLKPVLLAAALIVAQGGALAANAQDWHPAAKSCFDKIRQDIVAETGIQPVSINMSWPDAARCINTLIFHGPPWELNACIAQTTWQYRFEYRDAPFSFDFVTPTVECLQQGVMQDKARACQYLTARTNPCIEGSATMQREVNSPPDACAKSFGLYESGCQ